MANKKISELSSAGPLTGTESVEIVQGGANVQTTTQDIADLGAGGGGGTWGSITGTLSSQTDLQAALNAKLNAIPTIVDGGTNYTLQASDLALITAGANVIIEGDGTGTLTIPLNSSVAFPLCFIGFRGFILVAVTGGITETHTNDSLDCDPDLKYLWTLEKKGTNTWNVYNGSPATTETKPPIQAACSDETTAITSGTSKITFRMPYAMTLTDVRASLSTAQSSGSIFTVDINKGGTTILSTKITIDNGEKTSTTATTPPVISDAALTDDAEITVDVDQIGNGTAKGLKITLIGN